MLLSSYWRKNMYKKLITLLSLGIISLSNISYTFAYTHEQYSAYQWAYMNGITTQPTIEAANLNWNITRQAFAKMIVNYLENVIWVNLDTLNTCYFPDENEITNDLKFYARKTCAYNIMWSNWTAFRPKNSVSRAQLWTVLSRILWGDEYDVTGDWSYIYHMNALKDNWIMNKINNPQTYAKRWDVMIMLKRTYESFGSNVYMNGVSNNVASNIHSSATVKDSSDIALDYEAYIEKNSNDDNLHVIYTWKDWSKYGYDDKFLSFLWNVAEKKWESDLVKYLEIETAYFKDWWDEFSNLDDEALLRKIWININDIDPGRMTRTEKEELVEKFNTGFTKIINENKEKNGKFLEELEEVTKGIKNDKFWLKEKYKKTKSFMDASNSFLDSYSKSILELVEMALSENNKEGSNDWTSQAFWLVWIALIYQWETEEYQSHLNSWALNTIELLGGNL